MDIRSLELALPHVLVNYLTDIQRNKQVQLSGRTVTGENVLIDIENDMESQIKLKLSGISCFISLVKNTYQCHICSVSEICPGTDKLLTSDAKIGIILGTDNHRSDNVLTCNIRRSSRAQVRNQEGIVKRLHLNGNKKCAEVVASTRQRGRPRKGMKTNVHEPVLDIESSSKRNEGERNDNPKSHPEDVGDITGERFELKNEVFEETNKLKSKQTSENFGSERLGSDTKQQDCATSTDDGAKQSDHGRRMLFLATRSRHLLSDSTREKLEQLAFKCPCCRYAALNVATFKYHLHAHHKLTWKEYKSKYSSFFLEQSSPSVKGSDFHDTNENQTEKEELAQRSDASDVTLHDFCRKRHKAFKPRKVYDRNKDKNKYICELCGLKYRMKGSLVLHLRNKHNHDVQLEHILKELHNNITGHRSELQTECPFCKEISSGQRIFTHLKLLHIGEPDFSAVYRAVEKQYHQQIYQRNREQSISEKSCPHCGAELKKCSMKRHVENHCKMNSSRQQQFHCHLCHFHSTDREIVNEHKATVHKHRMQYICETCGACYHTSVGLRQHARIKHQRVWKKPLQWWTCQDCSKQFSSRLNLERHKPVHTREYHHVCTFCGKKFRDSSSLTTHCRNIHEGQYRYRCDHCGHGMERKSYLQRHKCESVRRRVEAKTSESAQGTLDVSLLQDERCEICINDETLLQNSFSEIEPHDLRSSLNNISCGILPNGGNLVQSKEIKSSQDVVHDNEVGLQLGQSEMEKKDYEVHHSGLEQCPADHSEHKSVISEGTLSGSKEVSSLPDIQSAGSHLQAALCKGITFVVHGSEEQVAAAIDTLDGLRVQDGSVILMETEIGSRNSVSVGSQSIITMNAAMSDETAIFLLPSTDESQQQQNISKPTDMKKPNK